jgi:hypothetical protein
MIAAFEVRLDDGGGAGRPVGNSLGALPLKFNIRVIVKPVPQLVARPKHNLKIPVVTTAEV